MIHVIAVLTAKPGMRAKILDAFHANIPNVHAEKGCIEYGPAVDADTPLPAQTKWGADTIVVIEKWESVQALEAHLGAAHMTAFSAKVREMLSGRAIHVLTPA